MSNEYDPKKIKKRFEDLQESTVFSWCPNCGEILLGVNYRKNLKCPFCGKKPKKDKK